jgi:hypothetical protein
MQIKHTNHHKYELSNKIQPNPSSLIQFKSEEKSMVHFLNKWGGGGGYLGEDLHGEERGREWPNGRIAGGGATWERDEERERMKGGRRKALRPNRY